MRLSGGAGLVALAFLAGSCGSRGELTFDPQAASVGTVETVIVSTARSPSQNLPLYTTERADEVHFAKFEISVPLNRVPGSVTFSRGSRPDASKEFVVVSVRPLAHEAEFVGAVSAALSEADGNSRNAIVYVHGFNTNFAEGLYRQAQLQHDLERHGASIHFSWPSAARLQAYVYDRESALFARDALEQTISAVARSEATEFNLVAHSMGAFLLMDTLRLMARVGHDQVFEKLNAVVLISPDIEIDVFRKQAEPVLARGTRIYLLVSREDRALRLSSILRGESDRLGSIRSPSELGGLDVVVIDLSSVKSEDLIGHFKAGSSPAIIEFVRGLHASGVEIFAQGQTPGFFESSVSLLQEGSNILLAPPSPVQ